MSDLAIQVQGLGKRYALGGRRKRYKTIRESLVETFASPFRRRTAAAAEATTFWALRDVNFAVARGEVVGIIGRNGAGKSTLLKVLSRITDPTEGQIEIDGRVGSLLEVGTGFHPELTGRENIYLNGAILGMRRAEIARKFDEIVAFAETERFLDTPVKHYSSGMYTRLAFAVAAHLDPEILVVDEVLAVGDSQFQKKCMGKMGDIASAGRTVLFVSHNLAAVQNLCTRGIFLRDGRVQATGAVGEVIDRYTEQFSDAASEDLRGREDRTGSGTVKVERLEVFDPAGGPLRAVLPGQPFRVILTCRADRPIEYLEASVDVETVDGTRITTLYSGFYAQGFDVPAGPFKLACDVPRLDLRADCYSLNIWLGRQGTRGEVYDLVLRAAQLEVAATDFFGTGRMPERVYGAVLLPYRWSLSPDAEPGHP